MMEEVIIDIDVASYGYNVIELELLIEDMKDIEEAQTRLNQMAITLGLENEKDQNKDIETEATSRGKLEEFFYRFDRSHFDVLCKLGIFLE